MNATMRAAILKDIKKYEVEMVPTPKIEQDDEVLIITKTNFLTMMK